MFNKLLVAAIVLLLPSLASAASITVTMTIGSQTVTSAPLTTDDASAQSILQAYTQVLNAGTPPNPPCAPNCTPQDVLTQLATTLAAQAAAFAQQVLTPKPVAPPVINPPK